MTESKSMAPYESFIKLNKADSLFSDSWFTHVRKEAFDHYLKLGFPTPKQEAWKYINLKSILDIAYQPDPHTAESKLSDTVLDNVRIPDDQSIRLVFVNGQFNKSLSNLSKLPPSVIGSDFKTALKTHADLIRPYLEKTVTFDANAFVSINTFSFDYGVFLNIPDGVTLDDPIEILNVITESKVAPTVYYPRVLGLIGKKASVTVILNQLNLTDHPTFQNGVVEFYQAESSTLKFYEIQRNQSAADLFSNVRFDLSAKCDLKTVALTWGGRLIRNHTQVEFNGEDSKCSLNGLSLFSGSTQHYNSYSSVAS